MADVTMKSIRQAGLTMADVARATGLPYFKVWKHASGGGVLQPDEVDRLRRVIEEATQQPA